MGTIGIHQYLFQTLFQLETVHIFKPLFCFFMKLESWLQSIYHRAYLVLIQFPVQNERGTFGKQMLKERDKLDKDVEKQTFSWPKTLMNKA